MILISLCYALGLCHSFKSCALPPSLLFHALFPEPCLSPQCCLYSLLEEQPENSWPLGGKCCIISNPSRYSGLHLPCFLHVQHQHETGTRCLLEVDLLVAPPSRAIGLPAIMFATLGVSPEGFWGPNPYQPSPKVTNIPPDQISTPLLWNI